MLIPTSLILICLLPTPRDLELARLLGWYRIPFRTAPKVVAVDYLAFYQPNSFGAQGGQIQYVAEVRGHELTTRAELLRDEPEHPRAREEYFKIQLGALEKLKAPVKAEKWRRITFFYTPPANTFYAPKHSMTWLLTVTSANSSGTPCANGQKMNSFTKLTYPKWIYLPKY